MSERKATGRRQRTWSARIRRRAGLTAVLLLAPAIAVTGSAETALANSGITTKPWGSSGYTVSSSSYAYSNMTGMIQNLINSLGEGCTLQVDGIFGNTTTWYLAYFQNIVLGGNNGGIMNPGTWNSFYYAITPGQSYGALIQETFVDGYGTQYYSYYTGGNSAKLGWNPFVVQWLFSQDRNNPGALNWASTNRTITSACG